MPSVEGLYVVEFGDVQAQGIYRNGGVAVLETLRIFGGDSGYYYVGNFSVNFLSNTRKGNIRACRQLSQHSTATRWNAARKFLAVLS
jgi:hypothetical protein